MSILSGLGNLRPWQRVGLAISASHLLIWVIYLLWLHRPGHGIVYFAPPDWNFFPDPALRLILPYWNLYWPYHILNLPVNLSYAPLGDFLWRHYRDGIYDVQLPTAEVLINYSYHLIAFAVWWFVLGAIPALLARRALTEDTPLPIDLQAIVHKNKAFFRKLVRWFVFSIIFLVVFAIGTGFLLSADEGQGLLNWGLLCAIISGVSLWAVLGIPFLALEAWYKKRRLSAAFSELKMPGNSAT